MNDLKKIFKTTHLIPSQKILLEEIDSRFKIIGSRKITNAEELLTALKTKSKIENFSKETEIPNKYLTVLNRTVKGFHPSPRKFKDFPGLDGKLVDKVEKLGIKTTVQLFDEIETAKKRKGFQKRLGATKEEILHLAKLTDLCRMRYVNGTFANLLVCSPYSTVILISRADPQEMLEELRGMNQNGEYYTGNFGLSDIQFLVDEAKKMPEGIEF
jgi:hypothetical protein